MSTPPSPQPPTRLAQRRFVQVSLMFLFLAAALFVPAGRFDWWDAWVFLAAYYAITLTAVLQMIRTDPALSAERARWRPESKRWDRIIVSFNGLLTVLMYVVIGLDAGRFAGSNVPPWLRLLAIAALVPGFGLPIWSSRVNTYLSGTVSIQADRGHQAVSAGPYRWIRHPMYAGMILYDLSVPLLLGSWWGLVVGAAMILLLVVRTSLEDRTLQAELPGYAEYARRVRYRLLPGLW